MDEQTHSPLALIATLVVIQILVGAVSSILSDSDTVVLFERGHAQLQQPANQLEAAADDQQ